MKSLWKMVGFFAIRKGVFRRRSKNNSRTKIIDRKGNLEYVFQVIKVSDNVACVSERAKFKDGIFYRFNLQV